MIGQKEMIKRMKQYKFNLNLMRSRMQRNNLKIHKRNCKV